MVRYGVDANNDMPDAYRRDGGSVRNAPYDQGYGYDSALIVVDGDLSDEKLSDLISRRTEYPELDYKAKVDLGTVGKRDLLELVKDIGAMQVRGGYILIGVDDRGSIMGTMDEIDTRPFDEAQPYRKG
jgi:hypothetical protein